MLSKQVYILMKVIGGGHRDVIEIFTDYRDAQHYRNTKLPAFTKTEIDQKTLNYNKGDF